MNGFLLTIPDMGSGLHCKDLMTWAQAGTGAVGGSCLQFRASGPPGVEAAGGAGLLTAPSAAGSPTVASWDLEFSKGTLLPESKSGRFLG